MEASSVIDAAARGASTAINIVLNIAANLVAFVSLLYLVNSVAAWLGALVGLPDFSFEVGDGALGRARPNGRREARTRLSPS